LPVPNYQAFFNPTLKALTDLGGSASIAELEDVVPRLMNLSDADIAEMHDERQTKVQYRMAWARTYLKAYGLLDNSSRGVWVITSEGKQTTTVDPREVTRIVRNQHRGKREKATNNDPGLNDITEAPEIVEAVSEQTWRDKLLALLYDLRPDVFERLCQRVLRESGFVQVEVTGRPGDGGIDGVGIVRIGGLLSFPILFQCKRYKGSVGPSEIRDFRGAMVGRAERGLILTTGTFSRDAKREASRDGAPLIDLVDGEQLLDKLKELQLGVSIKMIEEVSIISEWFDSL
jgi:restriction system protein